jgi:hypothetical protein
MVEQFPEGMQGDASQIVHKFTRFKWVLCVFNLLHQSLFHHAISGKDSINRVASQAKNRYNLTTLYGNKLLHNFSPLMKRIHL